jgi:dihydropteroate synthase
MTTRATTSRDRPAPIALRRRVLVFDRVRIMGVINVTPDSFSDGGAHADVESAVSFGLRLLGAGADVLDIGGESTRPMAAAVAVKDEIDRVVPVIERLAAASSAPISVDTTKAAVADAALRAGADLVNDVSGGRFDPEIIDVCVAHGAGYVLGHVRGARIADVHAAEVSPASFEEVAAELGERLLALPADLRQRTIVDPGIGFGKGTAANVELLARAGELRAGLGRPVLVGPSRKRFLGELTGRDVDDRDDATVGACLAAVAAGADLVRVHDVKRVRDALVVFERILFDRGPAAPRGSS